MPRTDSELYTGITSASYAKVRAEKKQQAQAKKSKQQRLKPDAHIVMDLIAKEQAELPKRIWELTNLETTEENMRSTVLALKLYDSYLTTFKTSIQSVLRLKDD